MTLAEPAAPPESPIDGAHVGQRMPWKTAFLLGVGSFVVGAVAPLYDLYVPSFLERLGLNKLQLGAMMGLDNVLGLFLVPLFGAWSDRTSTRLGRRVPFLLVSLPLIALGLAALPFAFRIGFLPFFAVIVVLNVASTVKSAPVSALMPALIPSRHRSAASGILAFMMCAGAMAVLMPSKMLFPGDDTRPFLLSASLVFASFLLFAWRLREPEAERLAGAAVRAAPETGGAPILASIRAILRDPDRTTITFFAGLLVFQMGFQSFSSWWERHATQRFHVDTSECSSAFIMLAFATLVGSVPAGWFGTRYGRRRAAIVGMTGMAICCLAIHFAPSLKIATLLIAVFGICWSLPTVNMMPMAVELSGPARMGTWVALLFVVQQVAAFFGPAIVGGIFWIAGDNRLLFVLLAIFLLGGAALLSRLRKGFAEARP